MKITSLLIPLALLSALTAQGQLPDSFRKRLAQASRENKTIQCDFTQHRQVRRMKGEIELKGRFYYDNAKAMALEYTVPAGDKVIIRDDRIGRTIAEILIRKARAGLEVRVIYDAVGSWRLSRTMLRRMHEAGVETAAFEPVRFPWFTTRVTRRNHRKIVVTDGKVAYLGGINIAKYYLDGDYMGKWRDEHLRIEGDAVADLQKLFIADWARVRGECLDIRRHIAPHGIRQRLPIQLAWSEEGPSRLTIAEAFAAAIVRAQRRVRISSPYFLPPAMLLDALRLAARSGVRVQVMIPTCSDSPFTDLISDSYAGDLLDAGIELYRYDNGFLHAKLLIVDDDTASVGTANMDYRSLLDNLEVTAFIRDREVVRELSATFDGDLASCRRIVRDEWRPAAWRRTLGDVLRLVSPLM